MKSHAHGPTRLRRAIAAGASITLAATLPLLGVSAANATEPTDAQELLGSELFVDGRYIVQLSDEPVATYSGATTLAATADGGDVDFSSPQAVAYADHLEQEQSDAAGRVGADVDAHLTSVLNGFVADLSGQQAFDLQRDPRVRNIVLDEILQIQASPATEYLELEANFAQLNGGWDNAGEGVVVGVLDTGIAPENLFFAGDALGTSPGEDPYLVGGEIHFTKGDGSTFIGVCETGAQFTADMCNTKLIGARYFLDGFASQRPIGDETTGTGEFASPRDGNGHGSHTASTAAGNANVPITSMGGVDLGTMSGVAPAAKISSYKVCWEGPDPAVTTDDGCATSDLLAGIEAATADGVDVINFSIGGGAATTVWDPIDEAFLAASHAGIFVSASAGNSGPGAVTADHAAPWYATVAAATVPNFEGEVVIGDDEATYAGASVTVLGGTVEGELVYAGDIPADGVAEERAALCVPGSIDPAGADGKIVVCDRGENARVEKSKVTDDAGAIGTVLVNVNPGESLDLDDHFNPTVHLPAEDREAVLAAADAGKTARLQVAETRTAIAPQVAGFSSRGPMLADGSDVVKPDITAPGVGIVAAGPNQAPGGVDGLTDPTFVFMSGTSMSAPHVAGLGAAYLGAKPNASPAEVKSVLTTSTIDTVDAGGEAVTDAFAQGSGMVQADGMLDAGFYFEADTPDYLKYLIGTGNLPEGTGGLEGIDPSDLNIPSIGIGSLMYTQTVTRTATALSPGTYTVGVTPPAGIEVVVEPSTLTFGAAGEEQEYTVTFTNVSAESGVWAQGRLVWSDGDGDDSHSVRQPIAVQPLSLDMAERIESDRTWDVQPLSIATSYTDDLTVEESGLVRLDTVWDSTVDDEVNEAGDAMWRTNPDGTRELWHLFEVTEGTDLTAVTTTSSDAETDFDLLVYRVEIEGSALAALELWQSGLEGSDEFVEILNPQPSFYLAIVNDYLDPTGEQDNPIELRVGSLPTEDEVGDLNVNLVGGTPATDGNSTLGFTERVERGVYDAEVSWQGLEPGGDYYGMITGELAGGDALTIVRVTPTEETPEPVLGPISDQTVTEGTAIADVSPALDDDTGSAVIDVEGLPAGVTFADGVISGTPTETGTFEVTVTATHELGFESVQTFTITVNAQDDDNGDDDGSGEPSPSAPAPSDSADPQPSEIPDDGSLPRTGADIATWLLLIAAAVALVGGGLVVARRSRA